MAMTPLPVSFSLTRCVICKAFLLTSSGSRSVERGARVEESRRSHDNIPSVCPPGLLGEAVQRKEGEWMREKRRGI